ncbi:MAG: helix-turn-helix domain-containing protein [Planctomycetota bacterium]|nr:helix-turn-helix transcriptional regulator [Planctomycetaceae bacterium]MDQ3329320.1 helix-turn-helix domain-containing protein [Planctomycetota bacterium]
MEKQTHDPKRRVLRELLRDLRREQGLRQADVAARVGEPQSFVSKYETGERRLDVIALREVCHVLGVSLAEFAERLEARLAASGGRGGSRRRRGAPSDRS